MEDWLDFFGWYISEGYSNHKQTIISQSLKVNPKKCKLIENSIKKLGYNVHFNKDKFIIGDVQLSSYLSRFGKVHEKYIPKEFKSLSNKYLEILLRSMMLGDGTIRGKSYSKYTTVSKRLCDDVCEILIKLGYPVYISKTKKINVKHHTIYDIHISDKNKDFGTPRLDKEPEYIEYTGFVWCVETDNNTILVNRNGNICWTGNSLGCKPCTSPIKSNASNIKEIIDELKENLKSENFIEERSGRSLDKEKIQMRLRALGYL